METKLIIYNVIKYIIEEELQDAVWNQNDTQIDENAIHFLRHEEEE